MNYELSELRNFRDELETMKAINNCVDYNDVFLFFKGSDFKFSDRMNYQDMKEADYIAVISARRWSCMSYTNRSEMLLGMFGDHFQNISKIPLVNGCNLVNIKFNRYKGSYYNEYKPTFVVEKGDKESVELTIDTEEEKGYPEDYYKLYQEALAL